MPHSLHSYPGYLCYRVLSSGLIGFPKLLNIVFSRTNRVINEKSLSILRVLLRI